MKSVHKSVLIWFSAQEMFDLVIDVARYPEFLLVQQRAGVVAGRARHDRRGGHRLQGRHADFHHLQRTRSGREVRLHLVSGPFSS